MKRKEGGRDDRRDKDVSSYQIEQKSIISIEQKCLKSLSKVLNSLSKSDELMAIRIIHQTYLMMHYIANQAVALDAELNELLPDVDACKLPLPVFFCHQDGLAETYTSINQEIEVQDSELKLLMAMVDEDSTSIAQTLDSSEPPQMIKSTRRFCSDQDSSNDFSQFQSNSKQRSNRRNGLKIKGYPTKNFLPNFKMPHLDHLYQNISKQELAEYPIVQMIHKKSGISMKDYQDLYSISAFADIWRELFSSRRLYQDLMTSRSSQEAKKIHQRKIAVFEKAFIKQEFKRIN